MYSLSSSVGRVGGGGPSRARGEMRHAASFDHGFVSTSPLRSFTAPTTHHPPPPQQKHDFFSPQQPYHHIHTHQAGVLVQPSSAFELLAAKVSGQQQQPTVVDKTARRLFTADTSGDVTTNPPHSESVVPTSLQGIFSQVLTSTADSTTTSSNPPLAATTNGAAGDDDLPLKVISLEQVEKQMVADVPSPVSINPLTLFGGGGGSGVSSTAPSTSTQPLPSSSSSATVAAKPQTVLLQPSAFMPNTANSTTTTAANPNPSVSSVGISIEPPSPVVAPGVVFANGGSTPLSNLKAQLLPESVTPPSAVSAAFPDQFFPPIPPIMHSPGMRAAPVSRVNQPQRPQPQQQSRGEPSSLVSTTTTSAHLVAQTSAAVRQGAGKPSQQIASTAVSTTEEQRRPPQSTPQRHTSQSTPSVSYWIHVRVPLGCVGPTVPTYLCTLQVLLCSIVI